VDVDVDGPREQEGVAEVQAAVGRRTDVLDAAVGKRQSGPDGRPVRPEKLPAEFLDL
jgi:hypothetical protein